MESEFAAGFDDIDGCREVYRVALDVLLKRVHGANQADRHAVAVQVDEFKVLLAGIARDMAHQKRTSFTEHHATVAETRLFGTEGTINVWLWLKRLIHKGYVPLLQFCPDKHNPAYRFTLSSFAEFLVNHGETLEHRTSSISRRKLHNTAVTTESLKINITDPG